MSKNPVSIVVDGGKMAVKAPFNSEFIEQARALGGKWNKPVSGAWNFDIRDSGRVRDLCMRIYGTDGSPTAVATIRVTLSEVMPYAPAYDELTVGPASVLRKFSRDEAPSLGDGCVIVSGSLQAYGGSAKYPKITYDADTIIEVRDIPVSIANALVADDPDGYCIVEEPANSGELTAAEQSMVDALLQMDSDRLAVVLAEVAAAG